MNDRIVVSGLGHLSALGQGVNALRAGVAGDIEPHQVKRKIQTAMGDIELTVFAAPEVSLGPDIPDSVRRRMSRISKMYFTAAGEALADGFGLGWPDLRKAPTRTGLVVGTAFGCLELAQAYEKRIVLEGPTGASPSLFASSIQNAVASHLSISFGIQGPVSTVTTMEQTAIGALRLGYDWIAQDVVDHVLIVVGDELTQFHAYAAAEGAMARSRKIDLQSDQCTAVMGEGMASVLLSRASSIDKKYCFVEDIQLYATNCPPAPRLFSAAYGGKGQCARYRHWAAGREIKGHSPLYGALLTGAIFEVAIAALLVHGDREKTVCLQLTDHDEAQTITLSP